MNMHTVLRVIIGLQVLIGLWYMISYLVAGQEDWSVLFIFFYTYIAHAVFFVIAAVTAWLSRDHRKEAWIVMGLPFVFLFTPIIMRALRGSERFTFGEIGAVVLALAVGGIVYALVRPRRVGVRLPEGMRRSRVLNWLVLVGLMFTWLVPIGLVALVIAGGPGGGSGGANSGMGVYYLLLAGGIAGGVIGLASLFTLIWSIVCLKSLPAGAPRGLNIAQAVVASPGLLLGAATLFLVGMSVTV